MLDRISSRSCMNRRILDGRHLALGDRPRLPDFASLDALTGFARGLTTGSPSVYDGEETFSMCSMIGAISPCIMSYGFFS